MLFGNWDSFYFKFNLLWLKFNLSSCKKSLFLRIRLLKKSPFNKFWLKFRFSIFMFYNSDILDINYYKLSSLN